jgi:hypothetical protein
MFGHPELEITILCVVAVKPDIVNTPEANVAPVAAPPFTVYVIAVLDGTEEDNAMVAVPLFPPKQLTAVVAVTVPTVAQLCAPFDVMLKV